MSPGNRILFGHVAAAMDRYVRELKRDGVTPPLEVLAVAEFLADCVTVRQDATPLGDTRPLVDAGVMKEHPLLTKREAAEALRRSPRTIERLIASGTLTAVKVEGSTLIRRVDLDAYIAGLSPRSFRDRVEAKAG